MESGGVLSSMIYAGCNKHALAWPVIWQQLGRALALRSLIFGPPATTEMSALAVYNKSCPAVNPASSLALCNALFLPR